MNSIEQQPNLSVSKGGTLIIAPPDIDSIKAELETIINTKLADFQTTLNTMLESSIRMPDYDNAIQYNGYQIKEFMKKPGYINVPFDCLAHFNTCHSGWHGTMHTFRNVPNDDPNNMIVGRPDSVETGRLLNKYNIHHGNSTSTANGQSSTYILKKNDHLIFTHGSRYNWIKITQDDVIDNNYITQWNFVRFIPFISFT